MAVVVVVVAGTMPGDVGPDASLHAMPKNAETAKAAIIEVVCCLLFMCLSPNHFSFHSYLKQSTGQ
jgi:hypothetical protein